jgi:hypothetical protein
MDRHQNSVEESLFELHETDKHSVVEPDSAVSVVRITRRAAKDHPLLDQRGKDACSNERITVERPVSKRKSRIDNFYEELEELRDHQPKEKANATPLRKISPQLPRLDSSLGRLSVRIKTRLPARPPTQKMLREPVPPQPEASSAIYHRRFGKAYAVSQNQDTSHLHKVPSREAQSESPSLPTRFRLRRFREVQNVPISDFRVPHVPRA